MVNTVAIFGKEGGELQSKVSVSIAKKRALDTLNQAKIFLWQQKKLNKTVQQSMMNESIASSQYAPVCFIETRADKNQISKDFHAPDFVSELSENVRKNELIEQFSDSGNSWVEIPKEHTENLKNYFNAEINKAISANDQHSLRVRDMIQKIAKLGSIQTLSI